jgi:DNA polymerase-1
VANELALVYDIETDGMPWDGVLLNVAWCIVDGDDIGPMHYDLGLTPTLRDLLRQEDVVKVSHTKYDPRWFRLTGVDVRGQLHDTQVMAWILNENQDLRLEALVRQYLGKKMDKRIHTVAGQVLFRCDNGTSVPLDEAPPDEMERYNRADTQRTAELYVLLRNLMRETEWWDYFLSEDVPLTHALLEMECNGLPVNLDETADLAAELEVGVADIQADMYDMSGLPRTFNFRSGDQLSGYLFNKVFSVAWRDEITPEERTLLKETGRSLERWVEDNVVVEKVGRSYAHGTRLLKGRGLKRTPLTDSGKRPATSTLELMTLHAGDEFVKVLVKWRKMDKLLTTYMYNFPKFSHKSRLYGKFNQTGTKTGRLSSSGPNLQNIPAHGEWGPKVRHLFQAPGTSRLIVGDYSQLEPRLMAHFSGDPVLTDAYQTGKDVYLVTAEGIFGRKVDKHDDERQIAKTLVLALGYGAGAAKLAQILSVNGYPTSEQTAKGYLRELQTLYHVLFEWKDSIIAVAKRDGYVTTLGGRHRRLRSAFGDKKNWRNIGYGERQAVNAVIQGSAGDIVRRVAIETLSTYPNLRPLAQVHDEFVWQYDRPEVFYVDPLESYCATAHGFDLDVPLVFEADVCQTWAGKGGTEVDIVTTMDDEGLEEEWTG